MQELRIAQRVRQILMHTPLQLNAGAAIPVFFLGNTLNEPSCNLQVVNDFKVKTFQVKSMPQKASYYFDLFTINHKVIKIFLNRFMQFEKHFFPSKMK